MELIKLTARFIPKETTSEKINKELLKDILNIDCQLFVNTNGILLVAMIERQRVKDLIDKLFDLEHIRIIGIETKGGKG